MYKNDSVIYSLQLTKPVTKTRRKTTSETNKNMTLGEELKSIVLGAFLEFKWEERRKKREERREKREERRQGERERENKWILFKHPHLSTNIGFLT